MKIINKTIHLFGYEWHFRLVPGVFRRDMARVNTLIFTGQWEKGEELLNQMQTIYNEPGYDDDDVLPLRDQINSIKRELTI